MRFSGRLRLVALGDDCRTEDLPPSILSLYENTTDLPRYLKQKFDLDDWVIGCMVAESARAVFRRILQLLRKATEETADFQKQIYQHACDPSDSRPCFDSGNVSPNRTWTTGICALRTSLVPELTLLCRWMREENDYVWKIRQRPDQSIDKVPSVLRNVERKEFFLEASMHELQSLFYHVEHRGYLELPQVLILLICRSFNPSLSMGISKQTARAIVSGPWAGDPVDIIPVDAFLFQFRSGELSPEEWRNIGCYIMPILIEVVHKGTALEQLSTQSRNLAASIKAIVRNLSKPFLTIEELLLEPEETCKTLVSIPINDTDEEEESMEDDGSGNSG